MNGTAKKFTAKTDIHAYSYTSNRDVMIRAGQIITLVDVTDKGAIFSTYGTNEVHVDNHFAKQLKVVKAGKK